MLSKQTRIEKFDVYGPMPENMFFSPQTLKSVVENDTVVQTITLLHDNHCEWKKLATTSSTMPILTGDTYTLKPCCRKKTYLSRGRDNKLYMLVIKE